MGIKISAADKAFGDCLKEAHDHTCERCGRQGRMETSHVYGRRHRTIRWHKLNANSLCSTCHRWWHENPLEAWHWFTGLFGEGRVELLREARDSRCKVPKSEEKDIAAHYRQQIKIVQQKRSQGVTGYIDFESYQ